ncbi:MAG: lipoate--protein ligase family protein [Candidatus Omnitrophica bacterium]|nr:lipoate--protein ligase family protein [Candidatus Omnitrophota bacterium]
MDVHSTCLQLIQDEAHDGAFHMAADEFLFRRQIEKKDPHSFLRFYRFSEPTFTVGYGVWRTYAYGTRYGRDRFQNLQNLSRNVPGTVTFVRRITGGGIVLHNGTDLTYSFVTSLSAQKPLRKVKESYAFIHRELQKALLDFGIRTELYSADHHEKSVKPQNGKSNFCFDSPVPFDVMLGDRKIAGGGQKRSQGFLLHQGSIAWEALIRRFPDLSEFQFSKQFASYLAGALNQTVKEMPFRAEELQAWQLSYHG